MFTCGVFLGSLGTSIFGNSSSEANNDPSRIPSRLSFCFLSLRSHLQSHHIFISMLLIFLKFSKLLKQLEIVRILKLLHQVYNLCKKLPSKDNERTANELSACNSKITCTFSNYNVIFFYS